MFVKTCNLYKTFKLWLCSPAGGLKSLTQADQISCRILKYLKFCCDDVCPSWEIPLTVVDYCVGTVNMISDFIENLKIKWKVGFAGIIGYMNSLSHLLDFRRISNVNSSNLNAFVTTEIYINRVKKSLAKKMRAEWNVLLSIDYLSSIDCWANLEEMQQVIPFHGDKFTQILLNSSSTDAVVPANDLSFATGYIIAVLFIMVKASRPMTFQFLTLSMWKNIGRNGMIDQTIFKTKEKYGFDTLIFSKDVQHIINGYITCVRPRLNPKCDFLLITRNGNQLTRLSEVFGRMVFQAIGKYINPTRYRQIVETESAEKLSLDDQNALSEDQKHTSHVAKVHYQKLQSRVTAEKGKEAMDKLRDESQSVAKIQNINESVNRKNENTDFNVESSSSKTLDSVRRALTIEPSLTRKRKRKVPFSEIEDNFLQIGIKKYGNAWTNILSDPDFKFHSSRQTATLCQRAKSCKFI